MAQQRKSASPRSADIAAHYASGYEESRLRTGPGKIEDERTRELLARFLPPAPATVLDVGGGPGGYACRLARQGYTVHLIDIVALHVQQARQKSTQQPEYPLASASVGDARALAWRDASVDAVVFLGPLYHLTDRSDRLHALDEARRVLKPDGVLLAAGISRFASTLDGLRSRYLRDSQFVEIVRQALRDGQHRNPAKNPAYFTDAFFHHPDELRDEILTTGLSVEGIYGVEGPAWLLRDIDDWWNDATQRQTLLFLARTLETEPSLLGVSAHLLAVARK